MNSFLKTLTIASAGLISLAAITQAANWTADFKTGKAELKSISQLTFGPEGILFVADSKAASVVAIATGDTHSTAAGQPLKIEAIHQKLAALLGTTPEQILIDDLSVNPISHLAYLAVSRGRGPEAVPVIVRVEASGKLEVLDLNKVSFSRAEIPDAPADGLVGEGNRKSNPRLEAITDIAFLENRVLIAGLSNEEFASTLRSIPFPFKSVAKGTSVEIYHGAHGRFETRSPIRTFVPFNVGDKPHLLAAYTCTPLVEFPLSDLQPGAKVKGKTIAELGNRNRPIDMIVYQKDGKDYLLLANSSRGVMKVATDKIEAAENNTDPVKDGNTKGLTYETVSGWTGVNHLDRFDSKNALVLRRTEGGADTLESLPLP
jgi:hypothetical protein